MSSPSSCIIIPGAQKSGTTSLYMALCRHPDVSTPKHKEPHFFAQKRSVVEKHLNWYWSVLGMSEGDTALDASTSYLAQPSSAEHIRDHIPAAKIVIVLRDPVKRAFSAFQHMRRTRPAAEHRTFSEVLTALEGSENIFEAEDQLVAEAARHKHIDPDYLGADYHARKFGASFDTSFPDPLWVYRYFQKSACRRAVEQFEKTFGEDVMVVLFERLVSAPNKVLSDVLEFADLRRVSEALQLGEANTTEVPNRMGRLYMKMREQSTVLANMFDGLRTAHDALLSKVGLEKVADWARRVLRNRPELSASQYKRARSLLAEEYRYWENRRPATRQLWKFEPTTASVSNRSPRSNGDAG